MSIAKVIEVISGADSIEDVIKAAVREAGRTVREIKQLFVEGIQALFFSLGNLLSGGGNELLYLG